ncbi:MAG: hypothetical protein Q9N02_09650 [Ghiorsea sp.]|nr:hypothetical protein [Ghiorsea sp.]
MEATSNQGLTIITAGLLALAGEDAEKAKVVFFKKIKDSGFNQEDWIVFFNSINGLGSIFPVGVDNDGNDIFFLNKHMVPLGNEDQSSPYELLSAERRLIGFLSVKAQSRALCNGLKLLGTQYDEGRDLPFEIIYNGWKAMENNQGSDISGLLQIVSKEVILDRFFKRYAQDLDAKKLRLSVKSPYEMSFSIPVTKEEMQDPDKVKELTDKYSKYSLI